jgi:hypothetical protein
MVWPGRWLLVTIEAMAASAARPSALPLCRLVFSSVSGRHWVRHDGQGGRKVLIERLDGAVKAIPPAWTSPHACSLPRPDRFRVGAARAVA